MIPTTGPGWQNNWHGYKWLQKAYVRTMRGAAATAKKHLAEDIKAAWESGKRTQRKGNAPQPKGAGGGGGGGGVLFKLLKTLVGAGGK